jgi:phenylalanyl-tRNA synthetase beta chain
MPTISIFKDDFERLLAGNGGPRKPVTAEQLDAWLPLVKGELKGHNPATGEWRIELQDSNRPDLWCCEGIARQVRIKRDGRLAPYPFFGARRRPAKRVLVGRGLERVRPYVAACLARGYRVTDEALAQLIQTQEKLADIYGRKRRTVSIGLYRLASIEFPVHYNLVKPQDVSFTPLGLETSMTLAEMLLVHPKGLEYGPILAGCDQVPFLRDAVGRPLSFPPIINSREVGEVQVGDEDLFVEVTGTSLTMVTLTLNIFAANLADRGAMIEPVEVVYPYKTERGKTVRTPSEVGRPRAIPVSTIEQALGERLRPADVGRFLKAYGYAVSVSKKGLTVKLPPYRDDVMHPVDVVEDVAISRGYGSVTPIMPSQFTVGGLSQIEQVADRLRELMVGMGFQEVISNVMGSRQDLCETMRLEGTVWGKVVEVANVMSQSYACLRQWILPSLLRVEAASSRAFYPHRIFEAGEVALPNEASPTGSSTIVRIAALSAHAAANFSEVHSLVDVLMYYLEREYSLEALEHPSFLVGRAGRVLCDGKEIGLIGELHPEVLERWQIGVPVSAFEIDVNRLAPSG